MLVDDGPKTNSEGTTSKLAFAAAAATATVKVTVMKWNGRKRWTCTTDEN